MSKLSIFSGGIFFLFFISSIASQSKYCDLNTAIYACQNDLIAAGLENIEIRVASGPTIWIAYENRRFRNEVTAFGLVLSSAAHHFPACPKYVLIPKYRNVAIKYLTVDREKFGLWMQDQISLEEFLAHVEINWRPEHPVPLAGYVATERQSSAFKFDFTVIPHCKVQFAMPGDPAKLQFNLAAHGSVTVAKGIQATGQLFTPIYDEFQHPRRQAYLGLLQIHQLIPLSHRAFLSLSAGNFEFGCSGISSQFKFYVWQDRLSFYARTDWLDTHLIDRWLPLDAAIDNRTSYLVQAEYRFEPIDFRARLTWGKYLLGDRGWRIDVMRRFRELELEFMGLWSQSLEFLTGMTIRIPFPINQQALPRRIRWTTPKVIPWNYRYLPCYDGLILNTGESFEAVADQLTFSFIRENSWQLKNAWRYAKFNEPGIRQAPFAERGN